MEREEQIAPAVAAILSSARDRDAPGGRVSVTPRSLPDALAAAEADGRAPVIAEFKPTSPTTDGVADADPVETAREMVAGGAAALSVLTEPDHFGGDPETLAAIREAVDVPVLRKDFVLDEAELDRVAADVVLLIARFVDDLDGLLAAARDRGFQVLVEVHTPAELRDALDAGADIVGVNNRDLGALEVDRSTFGAVAETLPADADVTLIAESGIRTPEHVAAMRRAGADGLLIGTAIMDGDVRQRTHRLTQ